jgi:hypothetical protein
MDKKKMDNTNQVATAHLLIAMPQHQMQLGTPLGCDTME